MGMTFGSKGKNPASFQERLKQGTGRLLGFVEGFLSISSLLLCQGFYFAQWPLLLLSWLDGLKIVTSRSNSTCNYSAMWVCSHMILSCRHLSKSHSVSSGTGNLLPFLGNLMDHSDHLNANTCPSLLRTSKYLNKNKNYKNKEVF